MTTWMLGGQTSVYLHEDRLEIGTTDVVFNETLARVAYRDARRLTAWHASRFWHLGFGIALSILAAGALIYAIAERFGGGAAVAAVLGIVCLVLASPLIVMGRPGGITKFRLEGVRGHVEGVLSGSRRKRDSLLDEIERRIQARQVPRDGRN